MAKGGVADVMPKGDGFGEVLVEAEGAADGAGDLADFEGVGEAGAVMVAGGGDEDLGLVFEASEGLGVEDAVAVALEGGADGVGVLGALASFGIGGEGGIGGEPVFLPLLGPQAHLVIHGYRDERGPGIGALCNRAGDDSVWELSERT